MSVEVERKFVCDADIQKKLEEIGAVHIGQREFQDQYYDTPEFHLTLRDFWLRCRKGCWELKCPTVTKAEDSGKQPEKAALCSRYKEITNPLEIQQKVREVMAECLDAINEQRSGDSQIHHVPLQGGMVLEDTQSIPTEDSWLTELNLVCFAKFTTVRCSFSFEGEGIHVDLDQADFGYCVGEIEVIVPEGEDIQPAVRKIEKTAQKLGLSGDQRVKGKMDVYLQKYCPEHYSKLLNAHIL